MRLADVLTRTVVVYLGSRFAVGTATMMLRAAIAWHVFTLTRSPFHLGVIGLIQFIPAFALTLVAGALADTTDRRRIMMTAQVVACASGVVLFLPSLVGRAAFPRVVTIASTNQALAFATGPALGGLLIADFGIAAAYAAYTLLILTALALLAFLPSPPAAPTGRGVSVAAIREGLAFVRRRPVVLGCMTLDMFAVIFGGASALLPIYATEILHVGPRGYGLLSSALEIGALGTSLTLIMLPPIRRAGRALLFAVAVYGLATIVFGLSRSFPLSLAAYMLVGVADQVSVVMRSTAIQLSTPDELRGRVSAVNLLFIGASNQLGAAESGFVAAATSATFAVVSGGIASLFVLAMVAWRIPELARYRIDR
jgi:MFS family permease